MPSLATVARFENLTKRFWIYNIKKRTKRPSKRHLETTETPILTMHHYWCHLVPVAVFLFTSPRVPLFLFHRLLSRDVFAKTTWLCPNAKTACSEAYLLLSLPLRHFPSISSSRFRRIASEGRWWQKSIHLTGRQINQQSEVEICLSTSQVLVVFVKSFAKIFNNWSILIVDRTTSDITKMARQRTQVAPRVTVTITVKTWQDHGALLTYTWKFGLFQLL